MQHHASCITTRILAPRILGGYWWTLGWTSKVTGISKIRICSRNGGAQKYVRSTCKLRVQPTPNRHHSACSYAHEDSATVLAFVVALAVVCFLWLISHVYSIFSGSFTELLPRPRFTLPPSFVSLSMSSPWDDTFILALNPSTIWKKCTYHESHPILVCKLVADERGKSKVVDSTVSGGLRGTVSVASRD
jgi:hypothetical protein